MPTRREFFLGAAALAALPDWSEAEVSSAALATDALRPQYHLLPARGWMNDPNGPIVWHGQVHLFYQLNPHGTIPEHIGWGHSVSPDLVHWQHMPLAMATQPGGIDSFGVFSGSCIADGERCLAFYTAVAPAPTPADVTLVGSKEREQQNVAVSTDADLLHWTRQTRAVIATPPVPHIAGFRDPSVWKQNDTWWMIVGSGQVGGDGCVLLYRATVPDGPKADWTYVHPLLSGPGNGKHMPDPVDAGTMWECPDLFELDGHHVLLYSTERKVFWMTGELTPDMRFVPRQRGMLDTGAYYAPKSMAGLQGERILWGWIPETRAKAEYVAAGWAGCMALPRVLHVDAGGMLRMSVAPAVDKLLSGPKRETHGSELAGGRFQGLAMKIVADLPQEGCGFLVAQDANELLKVHRSGAGQFEINGETVEAVASELTIWVDGSVIEIFLGDRAAHTVRSYPRLNTRGGLTLVVAGEASAVMAQTVHPISPDRLTT